MKKINIIGAGFAGLVAAISIARAGFNVTIFEHMDSAGKKIRATGNGRCNFAPFFIEKNSYYSSENIDFSSVFSDIDVEGLILFLRELGVDSTVINNGYYPASLRADSLLNALVSECERLDIDIVYNVGIRAIEKIDEGFMIHAKSGDYSSDYVILATGGKSYKKTGSDGSGYIYATRLGHSLIEPKPALCGIESEVVKKHDVSGVRAAVTLGICYDNNLLARNKGELQLTEYGLSGICVFNLSLETIGREYDKLTIVADFCPEKNEGYLYQRFIELKESEYTRNKNLKDALSGIFNEKLISLFASEAGIDIDKKIGELSAKDIQNLTTNIKALTFDVAGVRDFDQAQVTAGGIPVSEINLDRMESKLVPGLYFAGEVIDIQGICGGYNLLWAYYSALRAVKAIKNDQD